MESLRIALQPAVTNLRASWILPDGYDVIYTPEHIAPLFDGDRLTLYAILARRKDFEATSNGKRSRRSSCESVKEFWFEVRTRSVSAPCISTFNFQSHHIILNIISHVVHTEVSDEKIQTSYYAWLQWGLLDGSFLCLIAPVGSVQKN